MAKKNAGPTKHCGISPGHKQKAPAFMPGLSCHPYRNAYAAAETWALAGTEAIVFSICEAIW